MELQVSKTALSKTDWPAVNLIVEQHAQQMLHKKIPATAAYCMTLDTIAGTNLYIAGNHR
jgi:hypothetical protein